MCCTDIAACTIRLKAMNRFLQGYLAVVSKHMLVEHTSATSLVHATISDSWCALNSRIQQVTGMKYDIIL